MQLTNREMEIAKYIAWGYVKKEIAYSLGISYYTVDNHVRNIYQKLGIRKETDLTRWYFIQHYDIPVNPFHRIIAGFLLILALSGIYQGQDQLRVFRTAQARAARINARGARRNREDYYVLKFIA